MRIRIEIECDGKCKNDKGNYYLSFLWVINVFSAENHRFLYDYTICMYMTLSKELSLSRLFEVKKNRLEYDCVVWPKFNALHTHIICFKARRPHSKIGAFSCSGTQTFAKELCGSAFQSR